MLLSTCIDKFKDAKILVIGDIMLDEFEYGTIERISPEAPVPVFRFKNQKTMLGGAGNVISNVVALGAKCYTLGVVGDDETGKKIFNILSKQGVRSYLLKLKNYSTIIKTRFIAGSQHILRRDCEKILTFNPNILPNIQKSLEVVIKKVDVVLLSDYKKGLFTTESTQMIINICKKYNKKVIIDPKGNNYDKYFGAYIVKPNLKEFSEVTNKQYDPTSISFLDDIKTGAKYIFDKYSIKNLIVTLSEYGMVFVSANDIDDMVYIPTYAKEVYDVSGAGDTSLATFGVAIGVDIEIKKAMKLANLASGIVVGKLGTSTVSNTELKIALSQKEITKDGWKQKKKIITLDEAKEIVINLKQQNKKIGFTNGCFDCCHLGHLSSFMQAKKMCDILIVAVNSDASIKRYKGPTRPIQDEKTRALLLASMEFIDYVIVFDEDSPLHIVEALKPNVVAKEGYTLDEWPEGRLAVSYGGEAIVLKRIDGYSTSNLIKKMKG